MQPFKKNNLGFTLIELMMSMMLFAILMMMAFQATGMLSIDQLRISAKMDITKDVYFAVEQLVAMIQEGGNIDYEEYWNRTAVGKQMSSGNFMKFTGYGNYGNNGDFSTDFGDGYYYCRSQNGTQMGTGGCLSGFNAFSDGAQSDEDYTGTPQRYGQYKYQFMDYNYNANGDSDCTSPILGDEDCDGDIRGDGDDYFLGYGPAVFEPGEFHTQLYLYTTIPTVQRTFFRWHVERDPELPATFPCDLARLDEVSDLSLREDTYYRGCRGTIQMLRLEGRDFGLTHDKSTTPFTYDGLIDTWVCSPGYNCTSVSVGGGPDTVSIPTHSDDGWVDIFPNYLSVQEVRFELVPHKDPRYAWAEIIQDQMIAPYLRMRMTVGLAGKKKNRMGNIQPEYTLATTINLGE